MAEQWWFDQVKSLNEEARQQAFDRQNQLTKPAGSLGCLEQLAVQLASMQGVAKPQLKNIQISVFAADHGVAEEGVSAFPQAVTAQMIANFAHGGAAVCVLARQHQAGFEVINLGTVAEVADLPAVRTEVIARSSANFCVQAAMTESQLQRALDSGASAIDRAQEKGAALFVGGEMGIANTTSATALSAALTQLNPSQLAGPGTGIGSEKLNHKVAVIERALNYHRDSLQQPIEVLRRLGGFEIAALAGAYIRAGQIGMPVLVDGFISSAAALVATRVNAGVRDWLLFSHNSAEPGHQLVLAELEAHPLLDLQMRLGEGSGAALAIPLLRSACELHSQMATFEEASVAEKQ
ncbi:MAG: nicotinate-nucleotide--dimethylbenzimidazole phosphoribosyltransferase [Motiliproteus sp.]|nr:nicotinate-nucleotide--dimethylbenzimidazole phosphoribosyltransferase [Motiliproteus sp.]MCW9051022.1 nicotinate-nucleotide--dimethylbenzimidazole phosphoribosyltransferase [Motiliproteus sp.]